MFFVELVIRILELLQRMTLINFRKSDHIFALCFFCVGFIVSTTGLIFTIKLGTRLYNENKNPNEHLRTRASIVYLTIVACTLATVTMYSLTCFVAFNVWVNYQLSWLYFKLGPVCRTLYFICLVLIAVIAAIRLHGTLQSSLFQYPGYVYGIFWFIASSAFILGFLGTGGLLFLPLDVSIICAVIAITLYIILTNYIILLFGRVLYHIANKMDNDNNNNNNSTNKLQMKLFNVLVKYGMLVIIASLCSAVRAAALGVYLPARLNILNASFYYFILLLDLLINIISLSLQFPFNKNYYSKYCGCCHKILVELFIKHNDNQRNLVALQSVGSKNNNDILAPKSSN